MRPAIIWTVITALRSVPGWYGNSLQALDLASATYCREYRLPVKNQLVEGINLLSIVFHPASIYAKTKAADYSYNIPMQPVSPDFTL